MAASVDQATGGHELDTPPWLRVDSTLMATAEQIHAAYDERLGPIGLSLNMASLLAYVAQFGPVNQTRAAEHLGQGRASTGSQVDRLEADGLISRVPDPADRRVWLLKVTASGHRKVEQVNEIDRVFRDELRAGISRSERQQLAQVLLRLQQNLANAQRCGGDTTNPNTERSPS